jgi:hypothetical protein
VPLVLPPVKGAFIMPDVQSKPLVSKTPSSNGKNNNSGAGSTASNVESLPALPSREMGIVAGSAEPAGIVGGRVVSRGAEQLGPMYHPNIVFVLGKACLRWNFLFPARWEKNLKVFNVY